MLHALLYKSITNWFFRNSQLFTLKIFQGKIFRRNYTESKCLIQFSTRIWTGREHPCLFKGLCLRTYGSVVTVLPRKKITKVRNKGSLKINESFEGKRGFVFEQNPGRSLFSYYCHFLRGN